MPEARDGQSYIFTGWSLDGANVTNFELGGTLVLPNVDAIQEFTVLSGNTIDDPDFHVRNQGSRSLRTHRKHVKRSSIHAVTICRKLCLRNSAIPPTWSSHR
jgi:hypothetical protein